MSINSQQFKIGASITAVFTTGSQSPSLTSQGVTVSDLASNVDYTVLQCTGTPAVSGGNVPYVNLPPRTGNYVFVSNLTSTGSVNFQLFSGDTNVQSVSASETALLVNIGGAYKKVTLPNVTLDLSKLTAASTIPSTSKFLIQLSDGTQQSVTFATLLSQLGISSAANVLTAKAASTSNITTSGSQTVDGVSLSAGDVAFLTGQSLALNDGLYVVSSGSWQRSALYPIGTSAANYLIEVLHGSTLAGLYKCDNAVGSDIVGTDSLTWSKVCTGDGTTIKDTSGVLNVNHSLVLTSSLKVGSGSSGSFQGAVIQGISNTNGYAQVEVQNLSSGAYASTDFIATANNGTDSSNYVDLGINSSGYNSASWGVNGAGDAYLYSSDGGLAVGAAASGKKLSLFAGGSASSNIQAEVTSAGVNFTSGTTIVTGSLHSTVSLQTAGALVLTGGLGYNQIGSGSFAADRVVFASEIGIGSPSPVCYPSLYKRQSTAGASEGIDRVVNKIDLFESQQIAVGGTAFKAVYFNLHYSNMTFNVLAGDLNVAFIPHNGSTVMPAFAHTYFWSLYNVRQVVLTPLTSNFTTTLGGMTVTNPTAAVTSSIGSSVTPTSACYLSLTGSGATLPAELGISVGVWNGSATSVTGSLMVWGSACRHIITSSLS